jgi:hypothetical protein
MTKAAKWQLSLSTTILMAVALLSAHIPISQEETDHSATDKMR